MYVCMYVRIYEYVCMYTTMLCTMFVCIYAHTYISFCACASAYRRAIQARRQHETRFKPLDPNSGVCIKKLDDELLLEVFQQLEVCAAVKKKEEERRREQNCAVGGALMIIILG